MRLANGAKPLKWYWDDVRKLGYVLAEYHDGEFVVWYLDGEDANREFFCSHGDYFKADDEDLAEKRFTKRLLPYLETE